MKRLGDGMTTSEMRGMIEHYEAAVADFEKDLKDPTVTASPGFDADAWEHSLDRAIDSAERWTAALKERDVQDSSPVAIAVRTLGEQLCRLIAKSKSNLWEIEWRDLERVIATALKEIGFNVELTPGAQDGGKDVVARCKVSQQDQVWYVEIKHWKGQRVGPTPISHFVEVNARDATTGGLFLSSSGYTAPVYSQLSEFSQSRIRLGDEEKIVSLCRTFVRSRDSLWRPERPLGEELWSDTVTQ